MSCGCQNGAVKYADVSAPIYTVNPPKRKLTTSCDTFGKCGRVERNDFNASEGGLVSFQRTVGNLSSSFPKENFQVYLSTCFLSSIGLRQMAEEFAAMADELDGFAPKTTDVVINHPHAHHVKVKTRKKNKNKKAKAKKVTKKAGN